MESIWQSFHFIVFEKGWLDLLFQSRLSAFFNSWKCFIPWRDSAKQNPMGPFDSLSIWLCLRNGFGTFKIPILHWPFWNLENVLSPEGTLHSEQSPKVFQLFLLSILLLQETVRGVSKSAYSIGLFEIWKMFNLPKGTEGGPIVFTYILFWVRKRILNLSFQSR